MHQSIQGELRAISETAQALVFLQENHASKEVIRTIVETLETQSGSPLANAVGKAIREVFEQTAII